MKVMAQRLRYIVSFIYDRKKEKEFSKVCGSIVSSGKWSYDPIKHQDCKQDVYEFILDQFNDPGDDTNIGCSLSTMTSITFPESPAICPKKALRLI